MSAVKKSPDPFFKTRAEPPDAVVIGLDCITGLQTARILARHRIGVIGVARDPGHFGCRTRACRQLLLADTAGQALVDALLELGPRLKQRAVLFPCSDMSVLTISKHRARLEPWYSMALPDHDVIELLMDKQRFLEFAQQHELPIPRTFLLRNRSDAEEAARQLVFPGLLKPPLKTPQWEAQTRAKAYRVDDAEQLLKLHDQCSGWSELLMLQQWVEGGDGNLYSCNGYWDAGSQPLVTFIARKLRQWPPGTGTSCLGEECRNDVVLQESLRLFQSVNYRGLGYLEMKRDERTGQYLIIEPNVGRPTGRSAIAEAGGVELLYTMYCDCVGWPPPEHRRQQYAGVKWIYWRRDLQSAFYYWRRGELSLRQWWNSWRGRKGYAVFSWSDPRPFFADLVRSLGRIGGRRTPPPADLQPVDGGAQQHRARQVPPSLPQPAAVSGRQVEELRS